MALLSSTAEPLQKVILAATSGVTYLLVGWAYGIILVTCGTLVAELIPSRIRVEWT